MIDLYIDGKKADLTTEISVPMNYELEKLSNPTIIKNNFSKTIQLHNTPNNANIFSYYYKMDKIVAGSGFDANKRIPFELFRDGDLIESGYLQLNNIKYNNNCYTYEITLYGGLGDFFYNLSYDEEGNDLSLADLDYGYGENDEDMTFTLDAEWVAQAMYNAGSSMEDIRGGVISFIPSYNGLYEDFDNDKVLINTNNCDLFPTSITQDGNTYTTINGYAYAELNNEYTEWQMRDLRCHKQRPALRFKAFMNAICNPKNNGGYSVNLDGKYFFNRENPYYEDTYIALPLLNSDSEEWEKSTTPLVAEPESSYYRLYLNGNVNEPLSISFDNNSLEDMDRAGGTATIDVQCDFSLMVFNNDTSKSNLILTKFDDDDTAPGWSSIGVWLEAVVGEQLVGVSNCNLFVKGMWKGGNYILPDINYFSGNFDNNPKTTFVTIDGSFRPIAGGSNEELYFHSADGGHNTFTLHLNNIPNYENIKFRIKARRWFSENLLWNYEGLWQYPPYLFSTNGELVDVGGLYVDDIIIPNTQLNNNSIEKTLQNATITKRKLLKNKITPASLLTSFTKLFGLYFEKDIYKKEITISTKNKFFEDAKIIDISNNVDFSKEVKIEPLMFNKKWYKLTCPPLETTQMKTYKGDYYEAEYGQKRINTNYNFNTDTEDLYKDNQYQNIITMLDSSKYYRHFQQKNPNYTIVSGKETLYIGKVIILNDGTYYFEDNRKLVTIKSYSITNIEDVPFAPSFTNDGFTYKLFKNADISDSGEKEYTKYDIIDKNKKTIQWTNLVGADCMSKLCCFDMDNDKQSLNDLTVSLVFYNGSKYLTDVQGNHINYTISNDIPLMQTINEGTPMYLYSNSTTDIDGDKICEITHTLPHFIRYDIEYGNVVNSLDFGLPLETYINENYTEESTLYNKFWKSFYTDQFSENTRKVTAYVKFDDLQLNNKSLKNFYYFEDAYWLLNKIIDYDLAYPYKQVKCEFIKVNNISNYTNGQQTYTAYYEVDGDWENIEDWNILTSGHIPYGGTWEAEFTAIGGIKTIQIHMSDVPTDEIQNYYKVESLGGGKYKITIFNIKGDVGFYIAGKQSTEINVTYYFGDGVTPTSGHSHQFLQMAFEQPSENNIVFTNVVDEADSMTIYKPSPSKIYTRINPNPYYDNENRLMLGFFLYVTYDDGTQKIISTSSSTEQWSNALDIDTTKVVESIEFKVYQFADASYVPSPTGDLGEEDEL